MPDSTFPPTSQRPFLRRMLLKAGKIPALERRISDSPFAHLHYAADR